MKCCNNIESLGCFNSCQEFIATEIVLDVVGQWKVEIDYMGITKVVTVDVSDIVPIPQDNVTINSELKLKNNFNEDYEYIIRIYKPDGTLTNDTCYSFKTYKATCY